MLAILTEYLLDCLWILSQCVIGFAVIMLMIIGIAASKNTYNDFRRRIDEKSAEKWIHGERKYHMEERANEKWKED